MFYDNGLTFKLKSIIPTFEDFKKLITDFTYSSIFGFVPTDEGLSLLYYTLMTNYANAYVRQETPYLFACDLINVYIATYQKYGALFTAFSKVYQQDFTSYEKETYKNDYSSTNNSSSNSRSADTPTSFDPESDFANEYTNTQTKGESQGANQGQNKSERNRQMNAVDASNLMLRMANFPIKEYAQEFASLFVQIDNPNYYFIYSE